MLGTSLRMQKKLEYPPPPPWGCNFFCVFILAYVLHVQCKSLRSLKVQRADLQCMLPLPSSCFPSLLLIK